MATPLDEEAAAAANYNFPSHYLDVSTDLRRSFRHGPIRAGMTAPAISLFTLEGEMIDLREITGDRHVALVFGSYSAPPCTLDLPQLNDLARSLQGSESALVFVYTREIHPDEPMSPRGIAIPPHRSLAQKLAAARLIVEDYSPAMPILVDSLIGSVHRSFGGLPYQAVVIDRRDVIVFRSEWVDARQVAAVLANLEARDRISTVGSVRNSYYEGTFGIDATAWH